MRLTRTVAPLAAPDVLAAVKEIRRIYHPDEDALLQGFIDAAVAYLDGPEGILGHMIKAQTWEIALPDWPVGELRLPLGSVTSAVVTYDDADSVEQVLPDTGWAINPMVNGGAARPVFSWSAGAVQPSLGPAAFPVRLLVSGGAATDEDLSPGLRTLVAIMAAHWHKRDGASDLDDLPLSAKSLIARHRVKL